MTNDIDDFIDTLFLIERQENEVKRITNLENYGDKEDINEEIESQLKMLYRFKQKIPNKIYTVLSNFISKNDYYLKGQVSNFVQGIVSKETFLENLLEFGQEELEKVDKKKKEDKITRRNERKDWKIIGREVVENFLWQYKLEKSATEVVFNNAFKDDDEVLQSILKVYKRNVDKGDLAENLKIYGAFNLKRGNPELAKLEEIMTKSGLMSPDNIRNALSIFADTEHPKYQCCKEAKELYEIIEEEEEFVQTILACVKKMK